MCSSDLPETVRRAPLCRRRPATDGHRFQSQKGEVRTRRGRTRVVETSLSRNIVKELCDGKREGIGGVRDSPSHRRYPGQIDQGFGCDEGSEAWRARDRGRPKSYRAMGLESRLDKMIRPHDGLGVGRTT